MHRNLKFQQFSSGQWIDDIDITDYMVSNYQGISSLNMPTDKLTNFNVSAYRVLYILLRLVQYQSLGIDELNHFLQENPYIKRSYNNETITKYINTLRKVGCNIPKTSSKQNYNYVLQENPFYITLTQSELESLFQVVALLENSPDETLQRRFITFLYQVAWMLAPEQKEQIKLCILAQQSVGVVEAKRRLMAKFKQYCQDKLVLELYYQSDAYTRSHMLVEPLRTFQEKSHVYLLARDKQNQKQVKLDIEKILEVSQRPNKVQVQEHTTIVVFQLYDRLAKTYRPYPGETIIFTKDNMIQVPAKAEDLDQLLMRLLKYNTLCQVISPMSVRLEIRQRIERLVRVAQWGSAISLV